MLPYSYPSNEEKQKLIVDVDAMPNHKNKICIFYLIADVSITSNHENEIFCKHGHYARNTNKHVHIKLGTATL